MKTALLLGLCAVSVSAYLCPGNAHNAYTPPEYFGDCECDSGYTKHGQSCITGTKPGRGNCVGAGAWSGQLTMDVWCTSNCNFIVPYCPAAQCDCSGRRLDEPSRELLEVDDECDNPTLVTAGSWASSDPYFGYKPGSKLYSKPYFTESKPYNKTDPSQVAMCKMFRRMASITNDGYCSRTKISGQDSFFWGQCFLERMPECGRRCAQDWIDFEEYKTAISQSNVAISLADMTDSYNKLDYNGGTLISMWEWREYWEDPTNSRYSVPTKYPTAAPTLTSSPTKYPTAAPTAAPTNATGFSSAAPVYSDSASRGSGVSVGAVVACSVGAVGAAIGIGYFSKSRQVSSTSSAQETEMRMALSQEDVDL